MVAYHREQTNTPLTKLHLSDEMIVLLKRGRINNRLLCKLATHRDFTNLKMRIFQIFLHILFLTST